MLKIELDRDIVISYDEISQINSAINDFSTYYTNKISAYLSILDIVISDGISSGAVHENLTLFKGFAEKLKDEVPGFCKTLIEINNELINEFDIADDCSF